SAGVREALDKTRANGIADGEHYEGNRRRRLLDGNDYIDLLGDQLANESGKAIILSFGPSILDQDVFPLDVAEVTQPFAKGPDEIFLKGRCGVSEESYPWDFRCLLRIGGKAESQEQSA